MRTSEKVKIHLSQGRWWINDKAILREMFQEATLREVNDTIEKVQRFCRGKKYKRFLKKVNYKEFRYIVALLWNPQGYVQILTKDEQKELQNEILDF